MWLTEELHAKTSSKGMEATSKLPSEAECTVLTDHSDGLLVAGFTSQLEEGRASMEAARRRRLSIRAGAASAAQSEFEDDG